VVTGLWRIGQLSKSRHGRASKRIFDLVLGASLAVVTFPVVVVLCVASAISYRAWPLFTQPRLGRNGVPFTFVKIRSLPTTTPSDVDKYELEDAINTRFGAFVRRHHLDELPQLWLVVTGKMSLVGPRPEMPELSATFDPDFVAERLTVRPGCTGLWQVSTAVAGLIGEATEFDLHYVRNWTLRLDVWISLMTLVEIFGGSAVKDVGQVPLWTGAGLTELAEAVA
jgi:lipopolysaccharide/colanic/teichoic acid biosynthesis glycosyltransferase